MKRRGPSTEPWGTPWDREAVEEVQLLMLMNCCRLVRYDQERAVPVILREDSRRERREWLMVSNAAVRSRRMRMLRWPESEERRRSLVALRRADSVLCCERKPD